MSCPTFVELEANLVFSICCHDADTSIRADADSPPEYRVYADETSSPIAVGTMGKLDDANTVGFYAETLACTSDNGFEIGKTYTIHIAATVDGNTGAASYAFRCVAPSQEILEKIESITGPGADMIPLRFALPDGTPIANAEVWITADAEGSRVVAGTRQTDTAGVVSFLLDGGHVYYVWLQKEGVRAILGEEFVATQE